MHFGAEHRKRAGVFAADDACADDHQPFRQRRDRQQLVGVVYARVFERKFGRLPRNRTGCDQNAFAMQLNLAAITIRDSDRMRVDEARSPVVSLHADAREICLHPPPFGFRHGVLMARKVANGRLTAQRKVDPEQAARLPAGKRKRSLAQRLARNGSRVEPGTADRCGLLDERDAMTEQSCSYCARRTGRTAADDDEFVRARVCFVHGIESTTGGAK